MGLREYIIKVSIQINILDDPEIIRSILLRNHLNKTILKDIFDLC